MRQRSVTMLQRLNYFFYQGIIFWIFIKRDVRSERRLSECSRRCRGMSDCWYHLTVWHTSSLSHQILWKKEDGNNKHLWSPLNTIPEPLSGDLPQRHRTESSYETNRMSIEEKKLSFIWKVVKSDITSSERMKLFHYLSLGCCERAAHMLHGTVGM